MQVRDPKYKIGQIVKLHGLQQIHVHILEIRWFLKEDVIVMDYLGRLWKGGRGSMGADKDIYAESLSTDNARVIQFHEHELGEVVREPKDAD